MDAALNWLWQGCVVAVAWSVLARLLERARANVRYLVCWAALLLILVLPALALLGSEPQVGAALPLPIATADPLVLVPDAWWTSSVAVLVAWVVWTSVCTVRFGIGLGSVLPYNRLPSPSMNTARSAEDATSATAVFHGLPVSCCTISPNICSCSRSS